MAETVELDPTPRELLRRAEDEWLAAQRKLAGLPDVDTSWLAYEYVGAQWSWVWVGLLLSIGFAGLVLLLFWLLP